MKNVKRVQSLMLESITILFSILSVRVGLFNPPSEIKTSFVVFHFRCLIQIDHLHSIMSIDFLTKWSCHSSPSCHVPAGLCLLIKVNFKVMYSLVWSRGQRRVILVSRSRISQV